MSKLEFNKLAATLTLVAFAITSVLAPLPVMANSSPTAYNVQSTQSYANSITQLGGYDRYGTAIAVADHGWKSAKTAVLAPSGDLNMVDSLASASLAKAVDGPILLTNKDSITAETLAELKKLGVTKVYIVSGTAVISASVETQLTTEGITSVRLGGNDRFETAVNIAKELQEIKPFTEVAIVNGYACADAVSIGAIAASKGIPVLVVDRDAIPSTVSEFLATLLAEKSYVIGGTAVVSDAVKVLLPNAERLAGLDRFDTNREVLKKFEDVIAGGKLFFANGADSSLVDAITGAPLASKMGGAIVLSNKDAVPQLTKTFISTDLAIKNPCILGGTAVMSESAVKELCYADPTSGTVLNGAIGLGTAGATLQDVTINGSVFLGADGQTLKNVIVNGTVFVDPGTNGSATLENVKATKIVVLSGASNSVHLIGTTTTDTPVVVPAKPPVVMPDKPPVVVNPNTADILAVELGKAGEYAILSKSGISTIPTSVITGDIGVSPISFTAITGFSLVADATTKFSTSPQVTGNVYASDYAAPTPSNIGTAVSNMETAYTDAAGRAPNYTELYSGDISGKTLIAGVYKWGTDVLINSDVTLNGGANDIFIFQVAQGVTQANGTHIILSGDVQAKNIFWQVGMATTIGTTAHFEGTILCAKNITMRTGSSINGRLLAQTAVTLDQSTVTEPAQVQ